MSGESAGERWSPAQRVESVLISILSLLDDAEVSSPANVDASVMYRDKQDEFKTRVAQDVEVSKSDVPEGFVMPTEYVEKPVKDTLNDEDFWADSDAEGDFGDFDDFDNDTTNGSESDEALNNDSEDEEDFGDNDNDEQDLSDQQEDDDQEEEDHAAKKRRVNRSTPFAEHRIDSDMAEPVP